MFLALLLGYFLGSFPVAYWFGALRGRNVLREGSGNPGALNAYRLLGPVPGLMVLFLDLFKGLLAVALGEGAAGSPLGGLLGGVGAVWGHAFSPWLLFRG
ncbi:MAG: glycerol-3-phosphate acyltransferase, partial [Thermus sp.]